MHVDGKQFLWSWIASKRLSTNTSWDYRDDGGNGYEREQGDSDVNDENSVDSTDARDELVKLKKLKEYYSNALEFTAMMCVSLQLLSIYNSSY